MAHTEYLQCVLFSFSLSANVNAQDNFKWTPLHFACHSGIREVVEYMLDAGSNLEATALNGATPLIRAIESSQPDVVQLLIDRGAKMRVENRKGLYRVAALSACNFPSVRL